MSDTADTKIPAEGDDIVEAQILPPADNNSGNNVIVVPPIPNSATSPMDVDAKDDAAKDVPATIKTTPQIDNTSMAVENKEAVTQAAPAASAPTQKPPPRDQDMDIAPPAAAAPPMAATMNDNITEENISTNGVVAPIIAQPMTDNNTNSDAVAADTARKVPSRNSPMNILAAVASVESPTGEEQQTEKEDDVQMNGVGGTVPFEALAHNDIILSLKDSTYKTIMHQYYRKLDETMLNGVRNEDEEKRVKEEVYTLLKNAGGRLLKYEDHRRPDLGFIHVDEETARNKIGNDISRRNESKTIWGPTATSPPEKSKGVLSHKKMIVPQNIFLTLTNDYYRENLFDFFRKLGATNESQRDSEEEKRVKEEAYNFFKTSGGKLVKHINWKKPEMGYYEVDDESARTKISDDIRRRLESRDRWEAAEHGAATSTKRKNVSGAMDLYKLAEIASGDDEEKLPDANSKVIHMPPVSAHRERLELESGAKEKEPHGNTGSTYSYLDIYTLEYLKTWMTMPSHIEDPYPTEADKAQIIRDTGIAKNALYNWFVSNRTRKWKPAFKSIRSKYGLDKTTPLAPFMKVELAQTIFPVVESAGYLEGVFSKEGVTTDVEMGFKRSGAVLPHPWEEHFDDETNYFFYHNPETGTVQWKHPAFGGDEHYVAKASATKPRSAKLKPSKELFSAEELNETAKFNVGGNLFEVLCSYLPNSQESRIAQIANASIRGDVAIPIARDVELFSICVRFLRKGKADLPGNVPRKLFLEELDYFGIPYELDHRNLIRNPTLDETRQPRERKGKCGSCPNCLREDCGECAMCLDMRKFGGRGKKRQRCLERWCMKEGSPPVAAAAAASADKAKNQVGKPRGPTQLIFPEMKKEEASWEDEFAKIQAELNRKAEEAGKGGKTFGLTSARSKKPSRASTRNTERKRHRMANETSDDDGNTTTSGLLQSVVEKGYAEYSKKATSTGRNVPKRNTGYAAKDAPKPTAGVQKRYDDLQKKSLDASKIPNEVRGVTMRPSGKWQVQYYYCGSSRYIGVFQSKEDALTAYATARQILGKEGTESLTKEEIYNNVNLARNAAFSERGLVYTGPQAKLIQSAEQKESPKPVVKLTSRQKKLSEKQTKKAASADESEDEQDGDVEFESDVDDGRYSIKICSAAACDEVAVFGDRCIGHRPLCSMRGCQQRVHSDGKCKSHLTSSRRPASASRAMEIPYGVGYKFRKQFDGDLFEGGVIELLAGGGNDRRCKYLIDGFVEDLSTADLKMLATLEVENPVEFGRVGYRFRKQFNEGWYDGIVVKVLKRGANGKDRRVHYSADDDFEDLSLDDLRMLVSLDHQACDECRSRTIYCDGTQPFCLNNETMNQEVEEQVKVAGQSESEEEDNESRSSRHRSNRVSQRKTSSQKASPRKVNPANEQESNHVESFQPTDHDMILSLKDEQYRTVMFKAFRKLGAKKESERDKDIERQTKMDVFNSFKDSGVRMVKHINYRKPDLGLMEADDAYARDKINSDISRRLESKNRWSGKSDDDSSDDGIPPPNLKYRPRVSAKRKASADPEESSSDESELAQLTIEQDESKRCKLNEMCSVHGSSCTIYQALDVAPGWFVHIVPRKNGQHSPDKFFFSPTGEKFRSFISVQRHIEQQARKSSPAKKRKRAASPAESVDSNFHNDICECCGGLGELICCSTCNLVYHLECTRPQISELPEGEWSCAFCVAAGTGIDNSEPPLTKADAIQGVKDIEGLKKKSLENSKRMRTS